MSDSFIVYIWVSSIQVTSSEEQLTTEKAFVDDLFNTDCRTELKDGMLVQMSNRSRGGKELT